jgi:hypothetical protein
MKTSRKKTSLVTRVLAGAGLVFLACPDEAAAQPKGVYPGGPGGPGRGSPRLDTDGDGLVSYEEASVLPFMNEERFGELDANSDGVLDATERPRGPRGPQGPFPDFHAQIREADTNGDGQVTRDEFLAAAPKIAEQIFAHMDRNQDGVLSADDHPRGRRGAGSMREADANGDHQVTYDELVAVDPETTQEQFGEMDRNGDGVLSRDDHPEGGRGRRGGPHGGVFHGGHGGPGPRGGWKK